MSEGAAWVLVACAVLTTIVVVRREFLPNSVAGSEYSAEREAKYVDGWEEALSIGMRSGSAAAPVQVVEIADFQCPYCAKFEAKYPDQVAFVFVPFPLDYHEFAETAQRVAECAARQGRFDATRSLLYEKHQEFGTFALTDFAMQVGIADRSMHV